MNYQDLNLFINQTTGFRKNTYILSFLLSNGTTFDFSTENMILVDGFIAESTPTNPDNFQIINLSQVVKIQFVLKK